MTEPRLTVIVPVHDGAAYLADALASVVAQGVPDVELLVVDDGSTDDGAAIARRTPGVRVLTQPQRGPAAARNRGLQSARGALVAFLDADDVWTPGKLRTQVARLDAEPTLSMVSGWVQCVRPGVADWKLVGAPRLLPSFGALVARREVFTEVGLLDEALRCGEDIDWFMRARETGVRQAVVNEVVLIYRLHGANLTRAHAPEAAGHLAAVRKMLRRRRSREGDAASPRARPRGRV